MARFRCLLALILSGSVHAHAQDAADAYYDPERMAKAREQLYTGHGAQTNFLAMLDRFEWQDTEDDATGVWDLQGWRGGDIHRLWIKSEGKYEASEFDEAELQLLYGRAISPFFDLQFGLRHDFEPDGLNHAVLALQGLAPQWFEADLSGFFSEAGDLTARLELEYDALLTQRLVLQPRFEIGVSAQDVPELDMGSGVNEAKFGLRLRYEVIREFAPYIGLEWQSAYGGSADAIRAQGGTVSQTSLVAGFRIWY